MRRLPSSSGEDDDGSKSAFAAGATDRIGDRTSRDAARDKETARPAKTVQIRPQHPRPSRDVPLSPQTPSRPAGSATSDAPAMNSAVEEKLRPAPAPTRRLRQRLPLQNPWSCSVLTLATSLCAILLLGTILHSFAYRQQDPKGCQMSYMRPMFTRFADFDTEHTRFASKYSLYLYREGGVDEDTRVKGIPVIFIPGNAGSYKQVRPIAAEAANHFDLALKEDGPAVADGKRPLDFFSVDFNEDITAFHGQTLLDQAEYLNDAIAYILTLYHNPARSLREPGLPDPKSVIILGHSMGGVVARTMLTIPNYQEKSINTIVTLSAPHARAPVSFDADMVAAYDHVNSYWRRSYSQLPPGKNPLDDVTLVSVAGGGLDTMIPSEYASLTSLVPDTHGFTVFTSSIPHVWTGMDHLAIMWCDQFRKAIVKSIFDVVDARRSSQTKPQADRIKALRKRLLTGMEPVVGKVTLHQDPDTMLVLDGTAGPVMAQGQRLTLGSPHHLKQEKAHLMPIPSQQPTASETRFTFLTDQTLDPGDDSGSLVVLLCSVLPLHSSRTFAHTIDLAVKSSATMRLACRNAAPDVSYLPASVNVSVDAFEDAMPFSYLQFNVKDISDRHFVAVVEKSSESSNGWAIAEFATNTASSIAVSRGHHQLIMKGLHLTLPASRPMMTELKIPEIHSTLFAYSLSVKRHPCDRQQESFSPLLRQYIAEPYESKYFVNTHGGNINVHGISPYMPPPLRGGGATDGLGLQLWTDPTCNSTLELSLRVDKLGSAGKLVMRYRTVFAALPLLVVLIVLRKQFKVHDTTGVFMSFAESMDQCLRTSLPFIIIALTFLAVSLSKAAQTSWAAGSWLGMLGATSEGAVDFHINELMLGTQDPFLWFLVPLFGAISVGVCIAGNYLITTLMYVLALSYGALKALLARGQESRSAIQSCALGTCLRLTSNARRSETAAFISTSPQQRLVTAGVLLLLVTTLVPYQFAYVVLTLVHLATCVRALRLARDTQSARHYNFYNYTHSILVLMLLVLPINMPVLIVWIHNLAMHWLTPFSTHHNLLAVLPLIIHVEVMSTGIMIPRATGR